MNLAEAVVFVDIQVDIALLVTIKSELDILESFIASVEYKIANLYNFRIRENLVRYTQIYQHCSWKFPFYLIFIPEFPEYGSLFRNSRTLGKFSLYISVPFVIFTKISEFLIEVESALSQR